MTPRKRAAPRSRAGMTPTTQTGYENRNGQVVVEPTDLPGTDQWQRIYVLRCHRCDATYGANGSDIWLRKCPNCQGGAPVGLYWSVHLHSWAA